MSGPWREPPIRVPLWHPYLRTAALLRLPRQMAVDLMLLADHLSQGGKISQLPPARFIGPAAVDLNYCVAALEYFTDGRTPAETYDGEFLVIRGYLVQVIGALEELNGIEGTLRDPRGPVRAIFALTASQALCDAFAHLGSRVVASYEEGHYIPRLVENVEWALVAGVLCDLSLTAQQLHAAAQKTAGAGSWQRQRCRHLAEIVERQVERLAQLLPGLEDGGEEETLVDFPLPEDGEGS